MSGLPFQMPEGVTLADFEEDAQFPVEEPEPTASLETSFSPEVHNDVVGMLFLGALTAEFDVFGHRIVLSTLTAGEELAIAMAAKDYIDTRAEGRAMAIATVAASIETVDGVAPWPKPLGPTKDGGLKGKFDYLKEHWHWATVEAVYAAYAELLMRQEAAFSELASK